MMKREGGSRMTLEFNVYELKKYAPTYARLVRGKNILNEFIVVGESTLHNELDCFKVQPLEEDGIRLIGGLKIDEAAYLVPKSELKLLGSPGCSITTKMDVPKEYLTLDIVDDIQRLNRDLED